MPPSDPLYLTRICGLCADACPPTEHACQACARSLGIQITTKETK